MLHIKRFIDRMTIQDSKQAKDIVMTMTDARGLRDDISKLLADLHTLTVASKKEKESEVIRLEVKGGSFK